MFLLRLRSLPTLRIRHCFSHNMSSLSAAVSDPYPIPRDPSSRPLVPPHNELMGEIDSSASHVHARVMMMIKLSNLEAAANQALLTVSAARDRSSSSTATCDAIIGAMCRAGRYNEAFEYFHYFFNESNLKPNISCFNHIIRALCNQGRVDEALRFHRVCSSSPPNEETYSLLVKGLVDAGRIQEAEALIMSESQPSPVVFNHLIRGLLDQGKLETAMDVFRHLKQRVVSSADDEIVDLVHLIIDEDYNGIAMVTATFIEYWFKQGNDEEAIKWYTSLLGKNFVMNAITGNNLLRILLHYDKKTEAWALFDRMLEDHQFNAETCNIMVNECFANSRIDEAVNTFHRVGTNVNVSQLCYRNIISRFCEQGMLSEAGAFFEDMCSKQFIIPDIPTYRILLDAYANGSRFDDAQRMANLTLDANLKCIAKAINKEGREQGKRFGVEQYEMRTFSRDREVLENLKLGEGVKGVYISIDVDCLDPAFAPGVSHIEPGGLSFRDVLNILHNLEGDVVGADVVEFNPQRDTVDGMTAMVAAKLVRELAAKISK